MVQQIVCHEKGEDTFGFRKENPYQDLLGVLNTGSNAWFIDTLEVCCFKIDTFVRSDSTYRFN